MLIHVLCVMYKVREVSSVINVFCWRDSEKPNNAYWHKQPIKYSKNTQINYKYNFASLLCVYVHLRVSDSRMLRGFFGIIIDDVREWWIKIT